MNYLPLLLIGNSILNFFSSIWFIIVAILVLLLMITIHELGHYAFGKMLKFKINEFAVGFGKVLFSKTNKSGEKVSLRLVPLGGFCAFEGEDEHSDNKDAFNNKEPWKRIVVLFGGVLFNFISAILFSIILLAVVGNGTTKLVHVEGPNSSVIFVNDVIVEVEGEKPSFLNGGLTGIAAGYGVDEPVDLVVLRNGEKVNVTIAKYAKTVTDEVTGEESEVVVFGVGMQYVKLSFGNAVLQSVPFSFDVAWECIEILGRLFTGQYGIKDVGGPITTISVIANASSQSMLNLLLLIPLIAINLAVFNLLPIPALDGARIVFVLIEWVRGKPVNRDLEAKIHMIGLLILFSLVILVDILHFVL